MGYDAKDVGALSMRQYGMYCTIWHILGQHYQDTIRNSALSTQYVTCGAVQHTRYTDTGSQWISM
jgi:hypothetical protein